MLFYPLTDSRGLFPNVQERARQSSYDDEVVQRSGTLHCAGGGGWWRVESTAKRLGKA